jgi:hypothetical protein
MMSLRPAAPADLALLRRWDEQPHVMASDPNDDWGWEVELGRSLDWREQLIAEVDGRPVGFIQIIDPARRTADTGATFRRICARSTSGSAMQPILARATGRG